MSDLESTAQVYHTLYDNFLQRYMEAIQQQSFPITEARVISPAAPPDLKSGPVAWLVLGIAVLFGTAAGFGVATIREAIDRVFRTVRQVETDLQASCLAVLPKLTDLNVGKKEKNEPGKRQKGGASSKPVSGLSIAPPSPERADLESQGASQATITEITRSELTRNAAKKDYTTQSPDKAKRIIVARQPFMRQAVEEPLPHFAEAFRSIKVGVDTNRLRSHSKVIGLTSTLPGEGKSTVSSNLSELIAHAGKRVVLLDCDLRNPSLTRALARGARSGLLEVLGGHVALDDALYVDEETGLAFLPAVIKADLAYSNEVLASDAFRSFLEDLQNSYDYIVVDLPPVAPVVDVRATTQVIDTYIYVVEWGKTKRSLVQHQLASIPDLQDRLLGIVLNKADVRVLERYEDHYGKYYHKAYGYGGERS